MKFTITFDWTLCDNCGKAINTKIDAHIMCLGCGVYCCENCLTDFYPPAKFCNCSATTKHHVSKNKY